MEGVIGKERKQGRKIERQKRCEGKEKDKKWGEGSLLTPFERVLKNAG